MNRGRYIVLLVVAFAAGGVGVWVLTREDDERSAAPPPTELPAEDASLPSETEPVGEEQLGEEARAKSDARVREAQRWVRRYVEAIDARDGAVLCGLVEGVVNLDLPVESSSCAESVSKSIGYRDPRGYPVFEKAVVAGTPRVKLDGARARATVTVVTEFADREEASVEDDVIYLVRRGGAWVVAKPTSTLYRAIGTPDVPPEVLEPPE